MTNKTKPTIKVKKPKGGSAMPEETMETPLVAELTQSFAGDLSPEQADEAAAAGLAGYRAKLAEFVELIGAGNGVIRSGLK